MKTSEWERVVELIKQWGVIAILGVLGLGLVIYGLWGVISPADPVVEIVKSEEKETIQVMVDVGGAVENPGVYSLPKNSRIGEAISKAGGLSASADRNWVSRYVNLASPVEDGGKIYIPGEGENTQSTSEGSGEVEGVRTGKINLNTASTTELDSLWGIGEARASEIVANRPYGSVEELESKAGIPSNVMEKIKDEISVY